MNEGDKGGDARRASPSVARNRDAIRDAFARMVAHSGRVLEIASGTGEHGLHITAAYPELIWQPSDPDPEARASIAAWAASERGQAIAAPMALDVTVPGWAEGLGPFDAVVCINMIHIAPWDACLGLLDGAARILPPGDGVLYLYGPFKRHDRHTAPSNEAFDQSLRGRDARWGIRNLETVIAEAAARGLGLQEIIEMPANNLSVVFRKKG